MKLKYIFTALVATVALAAGCAKEDALKLDEVQVSQSYIAIPADGGKVEITVNAKQDWKLSDIPEWVAVAPASGNAGETKVVFTCEKAESTRTATVALECGGRTQNIIVSQQCAKVETPISTCKEANEGVNGKIYRFKGTVTRIVNTTYGNMYVDDGTGEAYIYGTLDASGAEKNFLSLGIEVGDIVDVEGPRDTYGTTIEFVNVTVNSIEKSLIKVVSAPVSLGKEAATFDVELDVKGDGIAVNVPEDAQSWISIRGINTADNKVTFGAAANEGGARETTLTFITTKNGKEYTAQLAVAQEGSIAEVSVAEFLAAEVGTAQYKISGFITDRTDISGHKFDLANYGNFDITDATGNVYIYGVGAKGDIATYGVKEGDIITVIGTRAEYKGAAQMGSGQYVSHKSVTAVKAADVAALADDNKADPQNYIRLTGKVTRPTAESGNKFDIETYGNFDLVDESGSIYVYGVTTGWNGESKKFSTLGVKEGDIITIVAYKTSYKENAQVVGMYVSHEAAAPAGVAHTSWRFDIPGDSDGGFQLITFVDETKFWLTSGDKEGIWWSEDDGFTEGTYTFDAETKSGMLVGFEFPFSLTEEGKLNLADAYLMEKVEFVEKQTK